MSKLVKNRVKAVIVAVVAVVIAIMIVLVITIIMTIACLENGDDDGDSFPISPYRYVTLRQ